MKACPMADPSGNAVEPVPAAATVTEDRLLGGRVLLRQPAEGYRAAIDPVLLAAAVPAGAGETVLDLGCGVGAASLCLLARVGGVRVVGLELQSGLALLARDNAEANGVADRLDIVEGDVAAPPAPLDGCRFDHVMINPPYLSEGGFTAAPNRSKALANQESGIGLAAWIDAAWRFLVPKGRLTIIHRADRVDLLCGLLRPRFGGVEIVPLWPRAGRPARRAIVRARRDVRTAASLLPGIVLHGPDGRFTAEAEAVLRDAAALPGS